MNVSASARMATALDAVTSHRAAAFLILFAAAALGARLFFPALAWLSGLALALLAACTALAAVWRRRRLAASPGMWLFHAALPLLIAAVLAAPLFRAKGYFELAEGQQFAGDFIMFEAGPLATPPRDWHLTQQPLAARYRRGELGGDIDTALFDERANRMLPVRFLDLTELDGYRLTPTGNMGYAAVLSLRGAGAPQRGVVIFPGYPNMRAHQVNRFYLPGGRAMEVSLVSGDAPYRRDEPWELRLPQDAELRFQSTGWLPFTLRVGGEHALDGGALRVEAVRRWLGYSVSRDPLAPLVFVAGALCVLGVVWHMLSRRRGMP